MGFFNKKKDVKNTEEIVNKTNNEESSNTVKTVENNNTSSIFDEVDYYKKKYGIECYNDFIYKSDFKTCLGLRNSVISSAEIYHSPIQREVLDGFCPSTEFIEMNNLNKIISRKIDISNTNIQILNPNIFNEEVEEILFPKRLSEIRGEAFRGFRKLKRADFRDTSLSWVYQYAFDGCSSLEEVLFSDKIFFIDAFAFRGTSLSKIDLKYAKRIDLSAFIDTNIECVYLPNFIRRVSFTNFGQELSKKLNVSYLGNDEFILKNLKNFEEEGLINLVDEEKRVAKWNKISKALDGIDFTTLQTGQIPDFYDDYYSIFEKSNIKENDICNLIFTDENGNQTKIKVFINTIEYRTGVVSKSKLFEIENEPKINLITFASPLFKIKDVIEELSREFSDAMEDELKRKKVSFTVEYLGHIDLE